MAEKSTTPAPSDTPTEADAAPAKGGSNRPTRGKPGKAAKAKPPRKKPARREPTAADLKAMEKAARARAEGTDVRSKAAAAAAGEGEAAAVKTAKKKVEKKPRKSKKPRATDPQDEPVAVADAAPGGAEAGEAGAPGASDEAGESAAGAGKSRRRRNRKRGSKAAATDEGVPVGSDAEAGAEASAEQEGQPPRKKKRPRKPKTRSLVNDPDIMAAEAAVAAHEAEEARLAGLAEGDDDESANPDMGAELGAAPGQEGSTPVTTSSSDRDLEDETQNRYEEAKGRDDLTIRDLQDLDLEEIQAVAEQRGVISEHGHDRAALISDILNHVASQRGLMYGDGVLEILPDGFGFLRSPANSYLACPDDIYVSPSQIRRFGLKVGHVVHGTIRPPKESERYFALLRVDAINGREPGYLHGLKDFDALTPLHPHERFIMEDPSADKDDLSMRIVDLVAPVGKGQRGLIVAPPRTGKTVLLQKMASSLVDNYPGCKVFVLLIDERPEEVTDFRNNTPDDVEVVASTFDENSARHVQVCEMVIEKSRRMVEYGYDVVILMDSITRMARAYNSEMPNSGRILSGGLDANALQRPKKFFGSARAIETGGSLTILATALVDTGSKADDIIFEEFKGTGNSELHLDRRLVEKRVYPAIDIAASGTRREELLMEPEELKLVYRLRKVLADMNVVEAMELLKSRLGKYASNPEFLMSMAKD